MITTLNQILKHTSTIYGQDIINELHNRKVVSIEKPQHAQAVLDHNQDMVAPREKISMRLQDESASKYKFLIGTATTDDDAAIALEELQNMM